MDTWEIRSLMTLFLKFAGADRKNTEGVASSLTVGRLDTDSAVKRH